MPFKKALNSNLLIKILLRSRQHKLDSVELVNFAGTRVIIYGDYVGIRISGAQLFYDTLTYDMVRQACERLAADDVLSSVVNKLNHFGREKPALTCLVSE